jgi:anhydro-N-acetylmuramic acid kinase
MKEYKVIGLMSGTSLDGIDAALISTDGRGKVEHLKFLFTPYDDILRVRLRANLNKPRDAEVERDLTLAHVAAVKALGMEGVDLIGFHGQTISHAPERGHTCQIGDGALLAGMTGVRVVNDFRSADIAAGGQGAPLLPVYLAALAKQKPAAFLNIGGVANVAYIGVAGDPVAYDTGPGNALLDDWVLEKTGKNYDDGGKIALSGRVDQDVLARLLDHPYLRKKPPKSFDRNEFASGAWKHLSVEDGAATLAEFTVRCVADSLVHLPAAPKKWVVYGGGRKNAYFMQGLARLTGADVQPMESMNLDGDAIEAEAFGYMAVRRLLDLPISFPTTTGIARPMTGGVIHDP